MRDHRSGSGTGTTEGQPPPASGPVVRDHRGDGPPPPHGQPPPVITIAADDAVFVDHRATSIKHVFVLMLENRSFDHMLGFSGITGKSAATGEPTTIYGLHGNEWNEHNGQRYTVTRGAPDRAAHSPGHSFTDVVEQLCGAGVRYQNGADYPRITNGGFVANFAKGAPGAPGDVMKCFTPEQLPVLNALAREFVVCDRWFSAMPGPTWPNRMYAHAASAAGFDESPSGTQELEWDTLPGSGVEFSGGNLFDNLKKAGHAFRIYADDHFPNVAELSNISRTFDVREFEDFASEVKDPHFDAAYTWIEPSYDTTNDFKDGNSQHPLGSVAAGEAIIKETYEAIRNSPHWATSMLIITWDEHGGFYDHVAPGAAPASGHVGRSHGFHFDHLGVRVPALVISPLVPKNLIEHRPFEHSSIPATVERVFGLPAMNVRDGRCNAANHLATLKVARTDTPATLPAASGRRRTSPSSGMATRPDELLSADPHGSVQAVIRVALAEQLRLAAPEQKPAILARVQAIQTRGQAAAYLDEVQQVIVQKRRALEPVVAPATI